MGRAHEVRAKAMAATAAKKSKLYSIYAKEIINGIGHHDGKYARRSTNRCSRL